MPQQAAQKTHFLQGVVLPSNFWRVETSTLDQLIDVLASVMPVPPGGIGGVRSVAPTRDVGEVAVSIHRIDPGNRVFGRQGETQLALWGKNPFKLPHPCFFIDHAAKCVIVDNPFAHLTIAVRQGWHIGICADGRDLLIAFHKHNIRTALACGSIEIGGETQIRLYRFHDAKYDAIHQFVARYVRQCWKGSLMHQICLHLYSPEIATQVLLSLRGEQAPEGSWWQSDMSELITRGVTAAEANRLTGAITLAMAEKYPTFYVESIGLTQWEAMIDRGIGMLMRPPARIFVDHGHNPYLIDKMPIRLEMHGGGPMGGAWIPPHLIPRLHEMIEQRLDLWAKRINDAELDPYPILTTLHMATEAAMEQELGLIESMDMLAPGARIVQIPDRKKMDPAMRERIQAAIQEEKQSLLGKLFRRGNKE